MTVGADGVSNLPAVLDMLSARHQGSRMSQNDSCERPKLSNYIIIRFRQDGVVAWTMGRGESAMGVREGPKTVAMREAIEAAYVDAVALEVKI